MIHRRVVGSQNRGTGCGTVLMQLVRTSKDLQGRPPLVSRCIYFMGLFFHGDALHTSRTQILPDLVASEAKHEASSAVNADPRISGHGLKPLRERSSTNSENERTGGCLVGDGNKVD